VLPVHEVFAWVMIAANAIAGVWCLAAHAVEALRVRALWWFLIAAQATVLVQVVLGVVLISAEGYQAPRFHMLYGFAGLFAIAILYSYRGQMKQKQYLLYGGGSLFIMGLGLRAVQVGTASIGL
jgi:hypothetical protein